MINSSSIYLFGEVLSTSAEKTLDRKGKEVCADATIKKRLLLNFFTSNAFALEIEEKNQANCIVLPIYDLASCEPTDVIIKVEEFARRLHIKTPKSNKTEEILALFCKKKSFFERLPKIIEQALKLQKIFNGTKEKWPEREENVVIFNLPIIKTVRKFYKFPINSSYEYGREIVSYWNWSFLGFENGDRNLELTLAEEVSTTRKLLGRGSFGQVEKQWHVNCASYLAYKRSLHGRRSQRSLEMLIHEYEVLKELHKRPESKLLALQPMPKFFYKIPDPKNNEEIKLAGYLTDIYETDLETFIRHKNTFFSKDKKKTFELCYELVKALAFAHEAGIFHNDIHRANIFVKRKSDEKITLDLCDWGCAYLATEGFKRKRHPEKHVEELFILPTDGKLLIEYEAKNQLEAFQKIYEKMDIYQLGILFYIMFTDREARPYLDKKWEEGIQLEPLKNKFFNDEEIALIQNMVQWDNELRPTAKEVMQILTDLINKAEFSHPLSPNEQITSYEEYFSLEDILADINTEMALAQKNFSSSLSSIS